MPIDRSEINRWILASALAALVSVAMWSVANILRGGGTPVTLNQFPGDEYDQLAETADLTDTVLDQLSVLTKRIKDRSALIEHIDTAAFRRRGLRGAMRDSIIYGAYQAGVAAAKDSARIAGLRALPLSRSSDEMVRMAEQFAGAERRMWSWFSESINWEREKRRPSRAEMDSAFYAFESFGIALAGYDAASQRGSKIQLRQLHRLRLLSRQRFIRLLMSYALLPIALGGLLLLVNFGRTGYWRFPGALGGATHRDRVG